MTTTDFIKLFTENEFGGATGRPREVMFETDDEIFNTDGVEVIGSGDGLFTELFLSLPSAKRKTGKWIKPTGMMPPEHTGRHCCSECYEFAPVDWKTHKEELTDYCPHCGLKMEVKTHDRDMSIRM